MRVYDIIQKKRDGAELEASEIGFLIDGYVSGDIPDYQVSAFLMAVYYMGMSDREMAALTMAMMNSGDTVDLSGFGVHTVDKHSTGGVGDKTTLIAAPIAASLGCRVPKMSGRGLGHTGGTLDKLESIPGFRTELGIEEFESVVKRCGMAVIGQTANITPADKKLYALRDVTATVDSIPLIASSVMSKKLAAGAKNIVLDVTVGSGAFMKDSDSAMLLAEKMVSLGKSCGRRTVAFITGMDEPLGKAVGNSIEVLEAAEVLKGNGPEDLKTVSFALAAGMVSLCFDMPYEDALSQVKDAVNSGRALETYRKWISAQGGDISYIDGARTLPCAPVVYEYRAKASGYISHMNAELVGKASCVLGAGRETSDGAIDHAAGIILLGKTGDRVNAGDTLAVFHTSCDSVIKDACGYFDGAISFSEAAPDMPPLIYGRVE